MRRCGGADGRKGMGGLHVNAGQEDSQGQRGAPQARQVAPLILRASALPQPGLTSEACLAGTHKNADKPGGLASKENYHKAMVRALDSGKKTVRRQSTLLLSSFNVGLVSEWYMYAWQGLEAAQLDEDEKLCLQRGTSPLP